MREVHSTPLRYHFRHRHSYQWQSEWRTFGLGSDCHRSHTTLPGCRRPRLADSRDDLAHFHSIENIPPDILQHIHQKSIAECDCSIHHRCTCNHRYRQSLIRDSSSLYRWFPTYHCQPQSRQNSPRMSTSGRDDWTCR